MALTDGSAQTASTAPRRVCYEPAVSLPSRANPRHRAAEVLVRVEADRAFAAAALDAALHRAPPLSDADRALATELTYGVLRTATALDDALAPHCRDGAASLTRLDALSRAVLRVAAYQILGLQRVPPRAAVHEAVEHLKRARSVGLAGFANAVLRKLALTRPDPLPDDARVTLALQSLPDTARARIADLLGPEAAEAHLRATLQPDPPVTLRINPRRTTVEALAARLTDELPQARAAPAPLCPGAVKVWGGGDPTRTRAYAEGLYGVQEEGAQLVAHLARVRPGMRVLDVCAGRGGKSAVLAAALDGAGVLHATDLFPDKLRRLSAELRRLGLDPGITLATFPVDLTRGLGALGPAAPADGYDAVLVDAPCSGLGTLGHRPDLLARLRDEAAWEALVATQRAILAAVAPLVRPGGVLVYAVCTLTRAEGDAVVADLCAQSPGRWSTIDPAEVTAPAEALGQDGPARVVLRSDLHGTDGFVVHRLRRVG